MSFNHEFKRWLVEQKSVSGHRAMLSLHLTPPECLAYVDEIMETYSSILLFGSPPFDPAKYKSESMFRAKTLRDIHTHLGQQTDAIIFDASKGLDLNAFYACAGMIKHAGVLLLLLPTNIYTLDTHSYPIKLSFGEHLTHPWFLTKMMRLMETHTFPTIKHSQSPLFTAPNAYALPLKTQNESSEKFVLSHAQTSALHAIVGKKSTSQISLIIGERGRGKSTLLAHIALNYIKQGLRVAVCTPSKRQFEIIDTVYQEIVSNNNDPELYQRSLIFLPADIASAATRTYDCLLVDEFASIAPDLIKRMSDIYPRIVLSGTISGYEGSASGASHRLLPSLKHKHALDTFYLDTPFRWLHNDPIEAFFEQLLCRSKPSIENNNRQNDSKETIRYTYLDKSVVVNDEDIYQQAFHLLSSAHYQTTPNDVVRILDANDTHILQAMLVTTYHDGSTTTSVIGLAVVIIEGGDVIAPLADAIAEGKRRVQGHLTPQSIALALHDPAPCTDKYLRVNRIAVNEAYRRKGIASGLLKYCEEFARSNQCDYLSSSFGFTDNLLSFWHHCGFSLVKLGSKVDAASGTFSIMLLKTLNRKISSIKPSILLNRLKATLLINIAYYQALPVLASTVANKYAHGPIHLALGKGILAHIVDDMTFSIAPEKIEKQCIHSLTRLVNQRISFKNALPCIVYYVMKKDLKESNECIQYYLTKGTHKEAKLALECRILKQLQIHLKTN